MRIPGKEQGHAASDWRSMAPMALFLMAGAAWSYAWRLAFLFGFFLISATLISALAGYLYRQAVLDSGRKPRAPFLVLRDDPLLKTDGKDEGT
jgi:hypothetical protein